jgi:hypothetical protein
MLLVEGVECDQFDIDGFAESDGIALQMMFRLLDRRGIGPFMPPSLLTQDQGAMTVTLSDGGAMQDDIRP